MIKNSHMEWVEMLFQKYSDMVFRTGVIYLKSEQEAYDIVQEVFLKLLNHLRQFKDEDHEKAGGDQLLQGSVEEQLAEKTYFMGRIRGWWGIVYTGMGG